MLPFIIVNVLLVFVALRPIVIDLLLSSTRILVEIVPLREMVSVEVSPIIVFPLRVVTPPTVRALVNPTLP